MIPACAKYGWLRGAQLSTVLRLAFGTVLGGLRVGVAGLPNLQGVNDNISIRFGKKRLNSGS